MAIPPSVAQLNGAGRRGEIGPLWRQSLWIALVDGPVAGGAASGTRRCCSTRSASSPEVRPQAAAFLRAIAFGAPALALYFCFRYLSEGLAWTPPTHVVRHRRPGRAGAARLRADVRLRPGAGAGRGRPRLSPPRSCCGCRRSASWPTCAARRRFADLGLFARFDAPDWPPIRGLLALGLPMGVSIFMEGSLFVATALLIGRHRRGRRRRAPDRAERGQRLLHAAARHRHGDHGAGRPRRRRRRPAGGALGRRRRLRARRASPRLAAAAGAGVRPAPGSRLCTPTTRPWPPWPCC